MTSKRRLQSGLLLILLPLLAFLVGVNVGALRRGGGTVVGSIGAGRLGLDTRLLQAVIDQVRETYYRPGDASSEALSMGAAVGIVDALGDPHSVFLTPEDASEFQESIHGSLEGIGAELSRMDDHLTVNGVLRDAPAQKAGLQAGDVILKIDGEDTDGMSLGDAVKKIRGPRGTAVQLTVLAKDAGNVKEVRVTRENVSVPSVQWTMKDGSLAHIELSFFREETASELIRAAQEALAKGAKGVVLDMRNNPGGILDEGVKTAAVFIEKGDIVKQRGRAYERVYTVEDGQILVRSGGRSETQGASRPFLKDIPLVVLVNGSSASASEIVAGAIQDYGRAPLVGEKTYGKGSVQELLPIEAGAQKGSSIKLTVAEWLTPKGRSIEKVGLTPDLVVERTDADIEAQRDPQLEAALKRLGELVAK